MQMKLFGILGNPVKHSKSPLIHNAWLKENNIDGKYQYILVEKQEELKSTFKSLAQKGFTGVNITVPYKSVSFEVLQNEGFAISSIAQELKAVNTVNLVKKTATNTDPHGFKQTFQAKDEHILIIGAGGVASSIVKACEGGNITIANRTVTKAQTLAEQFFCDLFNGEISKLNLSNFNVIINATSLGMNSEELPLNYKSLQKQTLCIDSIYNPKMTPFLKTAQKKGCKIKNGTPMLIGQAVKSFQNWTGILPNQKTAERIMREFIL